MLNGLGDPAAIERSRAALQATYRVRVAYVAAKKRLVGLTKVVASIRNPWTFSGQLEKQAQNRMVGDVRLPDQPAGRFGLTTHTVQRAHTPAA
jgi:hypothetical protein